MYNRKRANNERNRTGWNAEAKQYNDLVGERGHYYHQHVVFPNSLKLLNLKNGDSVLDLGCGQGAFARILPKTISYVGVDSAKDLISFAQKLETNPHHRFEAFSATRPLKGIRADFTHAVCILALQNMEYGEHAIKNAADHLIRGGVFLLVLNHPAFRIPRQSGWTNEKGIQNRWVSRYLSRIKIPILMHPGNSKSVTTFSYHMPIQDYVRTLTKYGFVVTAMDEWTSDRESIGKNSRSENRARAEIPLFLAIVAEKR